MFDRRKTIQPSSTEENVLTEFDRGVFSTEKNISTVFDRGKTFQLSSIQSFLTEKTFDREKMFRQCSTEGKRFD